MRYALALLFATGLASWAAPPVSAQATERYRTRLSPVPIDMSMSATITGSGVVTAEVRGTTLSVTGTFDGLKGPATVVRIHRSSYVGVPGPAIGELVVTKADRGTVSGSLTLTANQVEELRKGRLYVQVHSERAPDGNLRGWLTREER